MRRRDGGHPSTEEGVDDSPRRIELQLRAVTTLDLHRHHPPGSGLRFVFSLTCSLISNCQSIGTLLYLHSLFMSVTLSLSVCLRQAGMLLTGATHGCYSRVWLTGATHGCYSRVQRTGATHGYRSRVLHAGDPHGHSSRMLTRRLR